MTELLITRASGAHAGSAPKMGAIMVSAGEDEEGVRLRLDDDKNSEFWLEFVLHPSAVREIVRLSGGAKVPKKAKMTAEKFRANYPNAETNENCLVNIACSHCGNRTKFVIQGSIQADMEDMGTDRDSSDFEYDQGNYCRCSTCEHDGTVADFTIEGLDE